MELLAVGVSGYRRFEVSGDLDVTSNPIAIVGPNEVGKTSFLRALEHLNEAGPFEPSELTHGGDGKAEVRAIFALDDDDRKEIAGFGGVGRPTIFRISNNGGDNLFADVEPALERDRRLREKTVRELARLLTTKWFKSLDADDALAERLSELHDTLPDEEETIGDERRAQVREAAEELQQREDAPATAKRVAAVLTQLEDHEEKEHPHAAARNFLFRQRPVFLWFDEDRRQIESSYNLDEAPSRALENLFALIEFDLDELRRAVRRNDRARVAELTNEARDGFSKLFRGRWRQAHVRVELDVDGTLVHVFVTNTRGQLIPIAERSEGLRQFIALLAFVEKEAEGRDAIVLVDEAEQHLHYDGQADLVRVFSGQTAAKKIIYTTHSAGCLPHDLGMGVRVLEPTGPPDAPPEEWERSQVQNWFWSKGPGFSPLLLAMGASTFAFAGTRKAIVGEGISDALLLPTLIREATGLDSLDLQVAPGLANVNERTMEELDFVASRVVYLVDGDEGGRRKRAMLVELGVPAERILLLGEGRAELTLEDLLRKDVYVAAVNRELELRQRPTMRAEDLPDVSRKHALEAWAEQNLERGREDAPSERAVAHHLLEAVRETRYEGETLALLDPNRKKLLERLYERVVRLLAQPSYSSSEESAGE
jgi:hypothetical protein